MDLNDAEDLAHDLMDDHNLNHWSFRWSNARTIFGQCCEQSQTLFLSRPLVQAYPEAEVRDTILHEIAHALVGSEHNHDKVWKAAVVAIGGRPETTYTSTVRLPKRWVGHCPLCFREFTCNRRSGTKVCGPCYRGSGGGDDTPPIVWERNPEFDSPAVTR